MTQDEPDRPPGANRTGGTSPDTVGFLTLIVLLVVFGGLLLIGARWIVDLFR